MIHMNSTVISLLATIMIIGGALLFSSHSGSPQVVDTTPRVNNVSMENGKQIVEVSAKAGYLPKKTIAKIGVPTVLRLKTDGTFDCSSALRIPSMGINKHLPASGTTDIDIGTPQVASITGVCVMGMYSFRVDFQG